VIESYREEPMETHPDIEDLDKIDEDKVDITVDG
jgi:hypothetical protein